MNEDKQSAAPAPVAQPADLRERLEAAHEASIDGDDRACQAILRTLIQGLPAAPAPAALIGTNYCCEKAVGTGKTVCDECADAYTIAPAPVAQDAPLGAIINGRTHMDRLEGYPFECEAGPLTLCTDWVELRRCFEHLADWVQALDAAPAPVLTPAQIESAARRLAAAKSYHWRTLPESDREKLRRDAIEATGQEGSK